MSKLAHLISSMSSSLVGGKMSFNPMWLGLGELGHGGLQKLYSNLTIVMRPFSDNLGSGKYITRIRKSQNIITKMVNHHNNKTQITQTLIY
jgi:hypothetical protein